MKIPNKKKTFFCFVFNLGLYATEMFGALTDYALFMKPLFT